MHTTGSRPRVVVSADGRGVVSHAGSRLPSRSSQNHRADQRLHQRVASLRARGTGHAPGRVAVDLAVMLGKPPTPATAYQRPARAGATCPACPGPRRPLVTSHSEKEQAVAAYKRGFGYHLLLCFLHHIRALPDRVWHPALEQDGSLRDGAEAAELAGARLSLFDFDEGMHHLVFLSDTPVTGGGTAQRLEARHRAHARVEKRIRLLVWTQARLLDGELATAEPKKLRYGLLRAAARVTRGGRG